MRAGRSVSGGAVRLLRRHVQHAVGRALRDHLRLLVLRWACECTRSVDKRLHTAQLSSTKASGLSEHRCEKILGRHPSDDGLRSRILLATLLVYRLAHLPSCSPFWHLMFLTLINTYCIRVIITNTVNNITFIYM